ncbi:MAG: hypothetical protein ACKOQV_08370, partial [Betaproteobacteria bacterium]
MDNKSTIQMGEKDITGSDHQASSGAKPSPNARHAGSRRQVLRGGAAMAAGGLAGFPFISRGQSNVIKIGHLTPRTGFLGTLGEYAVQ